MYASNVRDRICDICPFGGQKSAKMSRDDFYKKAKSLEDPSVLHRCLVSRTGELCRGAADNRARMRQYGHL